MKIKNTPIFSLDSDGAENLSAKCDDGFTWSSVISNQKSSELAKLWVAFLHFWGSKLQISVIRWTVLASDFSLQTLDFKSRKDEIMKELN